MWVSSFSWGLSSRGSTSYDLSSSFSIKWTHVAARRSHHTTSRPNPECHWYSASFYFRFYVSGHGEYSRVYEYTRSIEQKGELKSEMLIHVRPSWGSCQVRNDDQPPWWQNFPQEPESSKWCNGFLRIPTSYSSRLQSIPKHVSLSTVPWQKASNIPWAGWVDLRFRPRHWIYWKSNSESTSEDLTPTLCALFPESLFPAQWKSTGTYNIRKKKTSDPTWFVT